MEYNNQYSLVQAQHYLVDFIAHKNYFINNNSKIYSKLFNAQLILNEYINNHLKSIHDNYNYKYLNNDNNDTCENKEEDMNNDGNDNKEKDKEATSYKINFPPIKKDTSSNEASLFSRKKYNFCTTN